MARRAGRVGGHPPALPDRGRRSRHRRQLIGDAGPHRAPIEDGYLHGDGGIVDELPGLYLVGLFRTAFASRLIGGAGRDAQRVARHIARRVRAGRWAAPRGADLPDS